jgi:hypothetical protein
MAETKVHLVRKGFVTACGLYLYYLAIARTRDRSKVTCKACKRTLMFRGRR